MAFNKNTQMYEGYIYKVTNNITGKSYIGQTTRTVQGRWKEHVKDAQANCDTFYFHSSIRKYGEDSFVVEEIGVYSDFTLDTLKNKLNNAEQYFIQYYNTFNPSGYNSTFGGEGGITRSIDFYSTNKKLVATFNSLAEAADYTGVSITTVFNNCNGNSLGSFAGFFRYHGEPLDKYSTAFKQYGQVAVNEFDMNGILLRSYSSCTELANRYNTTKTTVSRWLKRHYCLAGKTALFLAEEKFDITRVKFGCYSMIDQFSLNGQYITTFNNASEAARATGSDSSSIIKCCNGKYQQVKGFVYKKHIDQAV